MTATATAEHIQIEPEVVGLISEASTVTEIKQHLSRYHRYDSYGRRGGLKADLLRTHQRQHDDLDQHGDNSRYRHFVKPHQHVGPGSDTAVTLEDLTARAGAKVPAAGSMANLKPAALRALEKVVRSDYDTLLQQVEQAKIGYAAQLREQVEAEWKSRLNGLEKARKKVSVAITKANALVATALDEAALSGYAASGSYRHAATTLTMPEMTVQGRTEALTKANQEAQTAAERARSIIMVRRNAAMRALLLASVPEDSAALALLSVPSITEIMGEASSQAQKALEA